MRPYMGVTVHWCARDDNGRLEIRARLLAIHEIFGSHSGENLAEAFVEIVKNARILNRVRKYEFYYLY